MKLLDSLLQRQIVERYSTNKQQINLEFTIEALKCHKDDQYKVTGLDTQVEVPPFACSFSKSLLRGHMLAVADEDGSVCLFDLRKKCSDSKLKGWVAHSNAIFDLTWIPNDSKLVTASGDQTAQLWDIQHSTRLAIFRGHSCSLKSVDFQEQNLFVFATGARDGNIMIWDVRCNKRDGYYQPVNTIRNCHSTPTSVTPQTKRRRKRSIIVNQDSQQSVTSVRYQDMDKIISSGAVDGNIKVWDLRKNYSISRTEPIPCHVFPYPGTGTRKHGFSSLALDSNKSRLFANSTNDIIYMFDCISYKKNPLGSFHGHSNATFYVKSAVSPDNQFLLSGSGDCDAYIWKINEPGAAPFHLIGHAGEVTSVSWCPQDQGKVVTCSDDNHLKVWRITQGKEHNDKSEFVGWCERKSHPKVTPETETIPGNLQSKNRTPNTSPNRSCSSSASSSPVSLSPNPSKCSSPQQVLQSWLKSSTNKRPRESDGMVNINKRHCLGMSLLSGGDMNISNTNGSINKHTSQPTSNILGTIAEASIEDTSDLLLHAAEKIELEVNKENIHIHEETDKTLDQPQYSKEFHCHLDNPKLSETNSEGGRSCMTEIRSNHQNCENKPSNQVKINLLGDMDLKSRTENCRLLQETTCELGDKNTSKGISPLVVEPSSPDKEFATILKNMRCIRDYFKPITESDENSPSKYCER